MASRTIITQLFRVSHPHLAEKKAFKTGDVPSFMLTAMFPKTGVGVIAKTGLQFASHYNDIMQALQEVTAEEFGGWRFNPAEAQMYGIQFPPQFKDGDTRLQKDDNGNPIAGTVDPITKGHWLLTMKNTDIVGVVGPNAQDIDKKTVYSGCWCKAQIEVSAYTNKDRARIIAIKLLNVMMAYDDESFGGKQPTQAASVAFAGQVITNTNIAAGTGQTFASSLPVPPPTTAVIVPPPVPAVPVYVHTDAVPKEQYLTAGWTVELLVQHGKGRMETPTPPPAPVIAPPPVPAAPVIAPPPVPAAPLTPPPAPVIAPPAPPALSVPTTGRVIMKPDAPHSYQVLISNGWNDDQIIAAGYATPNFTNP